MSNIIKRLRILRGFTQKSISRELGIDSRTYCLKENNPGTFTVTELKKLADILGVEEEIFFKDKLTITVS